MQSSPLNFRRAVMWLGRLILGPIFIYAGYSKAFLPNSHFWPWFFFKFSLSTNIANLRFRLTRLNCFRRREFNLWRIRCRLRRLSSAFSC